MALLAAATVASIAYNAATAGRERAATALYRGPFVSVAGTLVATGVGVARVARSCSSAASSEPSWVWHRLGPLLGRRHRVFAIDLPPFGYTQRDGRYSLSDWVALLHGFEHRLGIVRPIVVGHSLGAAVAVSQTLQRPQGSAGIVLLDGDALAGGGPTWLAHLLVNPY